MKCYAMYCKRKAVLKSKNCRAPRRFSLVSGKFLPLPYAVTYFLMVAVDTKEARAKRAAADAARTSRPLSDKPLCKHGERDYDELPHSVYSEVKRAWENCPAVPRG